jgi:hypothetical protein
MPYLKVGLPIYYLPVLLVKPHNMSMGRAIVDILQELLDGLCRTLGLALHLWAVSKVVCRNLCLGRITFSLSVFRTQPVTLAAMAFLRVK